ncbi:MAG: hypothetical protein Q7S23_01360 [bacterium]|nr:hypothetical protein [bacterium]
MTNPAVVAILATAFPNRGSFTEVQMAYEHLNDEQLRQRIKELEAQGFTGLNNAELHLLNIAQTSRMSDADLLAKIRERRAQGKPTGKLEAAARQRGLSI